MNTAIIVAAGSGSRFDSEIPKQFVEILGKPLLVHTLERFEECSSIDRIVLVLASGESEKFKYFLDRFNLNKTTAVVAGGSTRSQSVRNGMRAVDPQTQIVAIHDGARPLVSVDEITRTIEAARKMGAACLVAAITDTIKEVEDGRVTGTLDRSKLRRALTPQAFRFQLLAEALDSAELDDAVTDESMLLERIGHKVAIVEGSSRNTKITHFEDLALAEACLKATQK